VTAKADPRWKCGESCTSGRPPYNQSIVEPGANAAAGGVTELAIVWGSAERHVLQFSARAAASEYRWLELHMQHSVAVVQPRQYQAARQLERQLLVRWRMCWMAWT